MPLYNRIARRTSIAAPPPEENGPPISQAEAEIMFPTSSTAPISQREAEIMFPAPRPEMQESDFPPELVEVVYDRYAEAVLKGEDPGVDPRDPRTGEIVESISPELALPSKEQFVRSGKLLQWLPKVKRERGVFGKLNEARRRGRMDTRIGVDYFVARMEDDIDRIRELHLQNKKRRLLDQLDPIDGDNFFSDMAYSSARIAGGMQEGVTYGAKIGAMLSAGAAVAGQLGPQAVLPEELVSVPAAFGTGMSVGTTAFWYMSGAGSMMMAMDEMGIDKEVSRRIGLAAGIPYAALERLGFNKMLPQIGPRFAEVMGQAIQKSAGSFLQRAAGKVGVEVAEEVGQEAIAIIAEETGKVLSKETDIDPTTYQEVVNRLWNTAKETTKGTVLLGLGSSGIETISRSVNPESRVTPETQIIRVPKSQKELAREVRVTDLADLAYGLNEDSYIVAGMLDGLGDPTRIALNTEQHKDVGRVLASTIEENNKTQAPLTLKEKREFKNYAKQVLKEKWAGYEYGMMRPTRFINRLQGGENGVITECIEVPMLNAAAESRDRRASMLDRIQTTLQDTFGINISDMISRKVAITPELVLTPDEAVEIHMAMQDPKKRRHLMEGGMKVGRSGIYKFTPDDIAAVEAWIETDGAIYKKASEWMLDTYAETWDEFAATYKDVTGKELGRVEKYSWIHVDGDDVSNQEAFLDALTKDRVERVGVVEPGQAKQRTGGVQPLRLGAVQNFLVYQDAVQHYIATARKAKEVGEIINTPEFYMAVQRATQNQGMPILQKWVKDILTENPYQADGNWFTKGMRALRTNAVVSVLGLNVVSILRQPVSILLAQAKDPRLFSSVLKDLMEGRYDESRIKFAEARSKILRGRNMERELYELAKRKGIKKRLTGRPTFSDVALYGIRQMDRYTVGLIWTAKYKQMLADGMSENEAIAAADNLIATTQPMANLENLPHFYRGSEWMKMFSAFTNQLNQNWNYWNEDVFRPMFRHEISAKEAGYRFLLSYILPVAVMSLLSHGGTPEPEDLLKEMAAYGLSPHLIFGQMAANMIQGFDPTGNIAMSFAEDFYRASKAGKPGKVVTHVGKGIGKVVGVPTSQPIRTVEGVIRLAHGEGDWRELVWSQAALGKEDTSGNRPLTRKSRKRRR